MCHMIFEYSGMVHPGRGKASTEVHECSARVQRHLVIRRQFLDFVDRELTGLTGTRMQISQGIRCVCVLL